MNQNNNIITMRFFVKNLNSFMAYKHLNTIKELSAYLELNPRRIESWLNFNRIPTLKTLDNVANKLKVDTHALIGEDICFNNKTYINFKINDSANMFYINLRKFLNSYDIKSADEFYDYFEQKISKHTYYSYFKEKNPKIPSLKTLEMLASYFYLKPYQLIERT